MRLLLLSNSTNAGEPFLDHAKSHVKAFLGNVPVKALFIPYAAVTFSFDDYEKLVKDCFKEIGHEIESIHKFNSPQSAIINAEAIVVGGGNTFHLLRLIQENYLLELTREKIKDGTPYIGWSAGSNIACPTICTTNDMPIVETFGFKALNLLPFQINPHYTSEVRKNHAGESRDERIIEYLTANQGKKVVGLREGTMLKHENGRLSLIGDKPMKVFESNKQPMELDNSDNLNFLLNY